MSDNRDNFKSGKKPFSRSGGSNFKRGNGNFKSGGDRFNKNDRSDRNDRSGNDRFNKPGGKPGYFSRNNNSNNSNNNNNNRSGGGFNKFNNYNKFDRNDRPERNDKFERNERSDGNTRFNKFDRNDRGDRFNKPGGSGSFNRFNKSDRTDRPERNGGNDRFNRNDKFDRNDRKPRFDNFKKFDKPKTFGKTEKFNKFEKKAPAVSEPADIAVVSTVEQEDSGMVYGRNAVIELLKSGKSIDKLFVQSGQREGSITMIFAEAVKKSIPIIEVEKIKLDSMINNSAHQGVIALASEKEYCAVEDILKIAEERNEIPFILIADKIMDPHNLGAAIRTAECAGVHGIIIPKRHAAGVSPIVVKTSAGASIHMAIAKVANIATTIEELQEKGLWVFASALDSDTEDKETKNYSDADYNMPLALVIGNEGEGLSPIVIQKSDFLVKIPMLGKIESLNVSCASAVLMYEVARQRMQNNK